MMRAPGFGAVGCRIATWMIASAVVWLGFGHSHALALQDALPAPVEIGAGPIREQAFALVGRTVFSSESAQLFGYLTDVIGLGPALLFTEADASVQTARFTYAGDIPLASRSSRGDVTTFAGEGAITIYYDADGGAAWDDPGSFTAGEPIAEFSLSLRDALQRQDQAVGVMVGDGRYQQDSAAALVIGGETFRFGQSGIEGRLRTVGALIANDDGTSMLVGLTGAGSVTAREAIPVIPGESGA